MVQAPTRFWSICADAGPGMANASNESAAATRANIRVMLFPPLGLSRPSLVRGPYGPALGRVAPEHEHSPCSQPTIARFLTGRRGITIKRPQHGLLRPVFERFWAARQRRRHPTSTEDSRSGSEHGNEHEADMFAVIKTGGKQYRVAAEDVITIDKVKGEPGEIIEFGEVLLLGGDSVQLGNPTVGGASVAGEVIDQGRGAKIIAFKKRRRKNSRRKRGHRQEFTVVRITEILTDGKKPGMTARPKVEKKPKPVAKTGEEDEDTATSKPKAKAKSTKKPAKTSAANKSSKAKAPADKGKGKSKK